MQQTLSIARHGSRMKGCDVARTEKRNTWLILFWTAGRGLALWQIVEVPGYFPDPSEDGFTDEGTNFRGIFYGPMECEREERGERVVEGDLPGKVRNVEVDAAPGDVNRDSPLLSQCPLGCIHQVAHEATE